MIIAYYIHTGSRWLSDDGHTFTDRFCDAAGYETEALAREAAEAEGAECDLYAMALLS